MYLNKSFRIGWFAFCLVCCGTFLLAVATSNAQDQTATDADASEEVGKKTSDGKADDKKFTLSMEEWVQIYPSVALAKESIMQGKISDATQHLLTAVADNPELPQAEVLLAEFFFAGNDAASAVASLDRAVKNFPDDPESYLILGNLAFTENRNTTAMVLFEKAATMVSNYQAPEIKTRRIRLRLHAGQASVEERSEQWEKAIPHLKAWVKIDPKNPAAHVRLARALFRTDRGKEAYLQARKPSQLDANFAKAELLIAQFYSESGKDEVASKWLAAAEKKYADDVTTRLMLGEWEWKQGRLEDATRHAMAATKLDESSSRAALLAGMTAHAAGDYTTAEEFFRQAQKLASEDLTPRNHLAMVLAAQSGEKVNEALLVAQANRRDFPNSAIAAATLGFVQFQLGQGQEAFENYKLAAGAGRGTGNMAYFFAKYWEEEGNKEEALRVLSQVMSSNTLFVFRKDAEALHAKLSQPPE